MAEWYVPAIVSYQAIHNNLTLKSIDIKSNLEEMIEYLESKTLSMDSKVPLKKGYWKKKHLNFIQVVYTAVKKSEEEGNIFDVQTLHERTLKGIDLLTYSFPCQDLSQQGKQRGMSKDAKTRSGLLWEIEKALDATPKKDLPQYLLMENVMALTHKQNRSDLEAWMKKLESLGYHNDLQVLNAAYFGAPQARRRAFMISSLGNKVDLPQGNKTPKAIKTILDHEPQEKDFMAKFGNKPNLTEFKDVTRSNIRKAQLINYTTFNSENYVYDIDHTGPTLTASGANSRIKIKYDGKIRKLNAREAFQYMGFTKQDFNKINKLNFLTETKMIYTCGNSISVQVLNEIMGRF